MRFSRLVWFSLALLLSLPAVSPGAEERVNLWPFFFWARSPEVSRFEALGPLFYRYRNGHESSVALRPLAAWVKRGERRDFYFLSPLGHYYADREYRHFRLVPLISYDWEVGPRKKSREKHYTYFPVFWGRTAEGKGYGGIFPLYGVFRERFGADEVRFFLWPLYSSSRKGEDRSTNILWPIFNYSRGPTLSGFKFWPLFGSWEKKGRFQRRFFLWPIFIRETRYEEGSPSFSRRMVWPLYVHEEARQFRRSIYLWPFFQHVEGKGNSFEQWDFPWPFFQWQKGEHRRGFRIWPLFGSRRSPHYESDFVLWPLLMGEHMRQEEGEEVEGRILLLSHFRKVTYRGREKEFFLRVWPLFVEARNARGESLFYFPALLPFYDEGVERTWGSLLRLFELYHLADGRCYLRVLWGLYRYEADREVRVHELAFLFSYRRTPAGRSLQFLDGLLGFTLSRKGPGIRLFWFLRLGPSV